MVLQVAADAGEVVNDVDAELAQLVGRAVAGEQQELRGVVGAAGEDDLALGLQAVVPAVLTALNRRAARR